MTDPSRTDSEPRPGAMDPIVAEITPLGVIAAAGFLGALFAFSRQQFTGAGVLLLAAAVAIGIQRLLDNR